MSDEKVTQNENTEEKKDAQESKSDAPAQSADQKSDKPQRDDRPQRNFRKNKRRPKRRERVQSEFDQKMLNIRRVTRVSSGGRRFTFSVAMVIGNRKGKVGVGVGKAGDTSLAIDKAVKNAKKNMIEVKRTKDNSIAHDVKAKFNSAQVMIMPAKGRGLIAGSALRDIMELAGITDINSKIISGSKNKLNIAKATVKALESLKN
jgi:small subunit ribosomal protein S5